MDRPRPFTVFVPEAELVDLRSRLGRTRFFDDFDDDSWEYGIGAQYVRELCGYWRTEFDWRAQEEILNSFDNFTVVDEGQQVHFIHARSPEPGAVPLLLVHGWPGSIFEFVNVIGPLTDPVAHGGRREDAFHVVCPSIPGFGLSGPTSGPGWGPARIARSFATLMALLGYERYGAGGGDWGAIITTELARADQGKHLIGLHLTMPLGPQPAEPDPSETFSDADLKGIADWADHQARGDVVHVSINSTRPHTLSYALNDSPAGLAAWLVDKFWAYSDCHGDIEQSFTKDELLAHVMMYWATGTVASTSRIYYERAHAVTAQPLEWITVPTGCTIFPADVKRVPRPWADRLYNIVNWEIMPAGGHFGSQEEPELYVDAVRRFFVSRS